MITEDTKEHSLQEELENGKRNPEHEKQYAKYFDVKTTPVTKRQIEPPTSLH